MEDTASQDGYEDTSKEQLVESVLKARNELKDLQTRYDYLEKSMIILELKYESLCQEKTQIHAKQNEVCTSCKKKPSTIVCKLCKKQSFCSEPCYNSKHGWCCKKFISFQY
jgi:hypothetical protein